MSLRKAVAGAVLAVTLVAASGCDSDAGPEEGAARPDGRLVLVSGRDDHGQLAQEQVRLYQTPAAERVVAAVDDGTLAQVISIDGQMIEVAPVDAGGGDPGWVDDYYLRGVLHLVGFEPPCRVRLGGVLREAGLQVVVRGVRGGQVLVESVTDPATRGWVGRTLVQEVPPRAGSCSGDPVGGGHSHEGSRDG